MFLPVNNTTFTIMGRCTRIIDANPQDMNGGVATIYITDASETIQMILRQQHIPRLLSKFKVGNIYIWVLFDQFFKV